MGKEQVLPADSELCGVAMGDTGQPLKGPFGQGTLKGQQLPRLSRSCTWVRGGHHRSMPEGQGWSGGSYVTGQDGPHPTETLATKSPRAPQPCSQTGQRGFGSGTGLAAWELHRCPWPGVLGGVAEGEEML